MCPPPPTAPLWQIDSDGWLSTLTLFFIFTHKYVAKDAHIYKAAHYSGNESSTERATQQRQVETIHRLVWVRAEAVALLLCDDAEKVLHRNRHTHIFIYRVLCFNFQ